MALCKNGITGNFSGKIAQVIGRRFGSKTIIQSVSHNKNRKTSVRQKEQETALSILSTVYTRYYPTIFDTLMSNNYRNESPFNWFVRLNYALFKSDLAAWQFSIKLSNNRLPSCFFSVDFNNSGRGSFVMSHQGLIFNYVSSSVNGYLIIWDEQFKRFFVKEFGNVSGVYSFSFDRSEFDLPEWRTYFFAFYFHDTVSGFTSQCSWFRWGSVVPDSSFEWLIYGLRMDPKSTYNFIVDGTDFINVGIPVLNFKADPNLFTIVRNSESSFSYISTVNPYDDLLFGYVSPVAPFSQTLLKYMAQPSSSSSLVDMSTFIMTTDVYGWDNWVLKEGINFYIAGKMSNFVSLSVSVDGIILPIFLDSKVLAVFDCGQFWYEGVESLLVQFELAYTTGSDTLYSYSYITLYP